MLGKPPALFDQWRGLVNGQLRGWWPAHSPSPLMFSSVTRIFVGFEPATFFSQFLLPQCFIEVNNYITDFLIIHELLFWLLFFFPFMLPLCPASFHREITVGNFVFFWECTTWFFHVTIFPFRFFKWCVHSCILFFLTVFPFDFLAPAFTFLSMWKEDKLQITQEVMKYGVSSVWQLQPNKTKIIEAIFAICFWLTGNYAYM